MGKKRKKNAVATTDGQEHRAVHRSIDRCAVFLKNIWGRPCIASAILFVLFFAMVMTIYAFVEGDPIFDDHYFHLKYAYLLRTEGMNAVNHFNWIYLLSHSDSGSRYAVSLFQISLIPFTYFHDWLFALRTLDAFYGSVVIALMYFLMRKEHVRHPLFFTLLLVGSSFFVSRILLGRALVLMIALVFFEMRFAIHRKYVPLFFVVLIHVLWHQSTYFLPLIIVGMVEFSRYLVEKMVNIKVFLTSLGGIIFGMMFFPGFPGSLFRWLQWIFKIQQSGSASAHGSLGGIEMATMDLTMNTFGQSVTVVAMIFCVMAVAYMYHLFKEEDTDVYEALRAGKMHWLITLTIFTLCMAGGSFFLTGRLFDFFVPALVLLLGFVITALLDTQLIPPRSFGGRGFEYSVWVVVLAMCAYSFSHIYNEANTFDYRPAQRAAEWIDEHSDDGAKVYLHNWSYFNLMFFTNAHNKYSMGIEPLTLKAYDESLYWKYYNIFAYKYYCELPKVCKDELFDELLVKRTDAESRNAFKKENSEKIINAIKNDFGAKIILSNSEVFTGTIALSPELIEERYDVQSEKYKGESMRFTVFKLK
jgi:hypothetical protein